LTGRDALLEPDGAGSLPLHLALSQVPQPSSIIPFLIDECPESRNIPDGSGSFPVHLAFRHPTSLPAWDVVERLVRLCPEALLAVPNADGSLALHLAVAQRHQSPGIIRVLVGMHPGSVQLANSDGSLPLHIAVAAHAFPSHDIVRALVEAWPDSVVATRDADGLNALHLALAAQRRPSLELTTLLVGHCPPSVRTPFPDGTCPLHFVLATHQDPPPSPSSIPSGRRRRRRRRCPVRGIVGLLVEHWPESLQLRHADGCPPAARGGRQRAVTAAAAVVVVVPGRGAVSGRAAARCGQREGRRGGTGAGPKGGGERRPARRDFLPDDAVGRLRRSAKVTRLLVVPTVASTLDECLLVFDSYHLLRLHQQAGSCRRLPISLVLGTASSYL
jgi:hypothetical protein